MTDPVDEDELTELVDADFPRVDLVGKAANSAPRFLIAKGAAGQQGLMETDVVRELVAKAEASTATMNDRPDSDFAYIEPGGKKDETGKTEPRSLRHFPIYDAAHVRNALSRAPQSPFGDKAMPAITAAAKKFGVEVAKAADDLDAGGDVLVTTGTDPAEATTPGSAEWEAIDAASAQKWTAILARAKNAIDTLSAREAAEGEDCEAMDLSDACCALDFAIGVLAPYAVGEQTESDTLGEGLASITKAADALGVAEGLTVLEGLVPVVKAGRILSAANESRIRAAVTSLQEVLVTLPTAPDEVAKAVDQDLDPDTTSVPHGDDDQNDGHEVTPTSDTTDRTGDEPTVDGLTGVAKAAGDPLMAVYSQSGKLLGAIDPSKLTPLQDGGDGDEEEKPEEPAPEAPPSDMTPAPAAAVGTPAAAVQKQAQDEVIKAAVQEQVEAALIAKAAEQAAVVKALEDRIAQLEEQPAPSRVLANGAMPPAHLLRGMADGAPAEVAKAAELQAEYETAPSATRRAEIQSELNALASVELAAIRQNPTRN